MCSVKDSLTIAKNKPVPYRFKEGKRKPTCPFPAHNVLSLPDAGQLRVGLEGWASGRVCQLYALPLPFLETVRVEYAPNNRSSCKKSLEKFDKGALRVVLCAKEGSNVYVKPEAVVEELREVFRAVGATGGEYRVGRDLKGLRDLEDKDQRRAPASLHHTSLCSSVFFCDYTYI